MCNFLGSVSSQQKLEAMDQHYNPRTGQCYSSRMDQCYSSVLFRKWRKLHPRGLRAWRPKRHEEERERDPRPFGASFYVFLLPLGLPCVNRASQGCCLFCLRSSLRSWDLPLFCFCGHSHRHFGLPFPYSNYLTVFSRKLSKIFWIFYGHSNLLFHGILGSDYVYIYLKYNVWIAN